MIVEALGYEHEPTPWTARAACVGVDGDVFFPDKGGTATAAKAICAGCAVRVECLDYAVRWGIRFGVWGGMTERERRQLTRSGKPRRLPPPHGTTARYAHGCRCDECGEANRLAQRYRHLNLFDNPDAVRVDEIQVRGRYL
jgi:WhiB family redox-sensing transcriptional regulator